VQPTLHRKPVPNGFVLLHTLVLLLVVAALTGMILQKALARAKDAQAELTVARLELAAESGVHQALYELTINSRNRGFAIGTTRRVIVDGFQVDISTQFVDGLVGLRSGKKELLQQVFTAALGARGQGLMHTLRSAAIGSFSSYADVAQLSGIGLEGLSCLLPYVSLYIENNVPVTEHAPQQVRDLLRPSATEMRSAVQPESHSVAGSVIRIQALATSEEYSSRRLVAEVLSTGRLDTPFWVLDWQWIPVGGGFNSGSGECG
jgi:hypothetical protein